MKPKITLTRFKSSEQGTKGRWETKGFSCCSLELPWRDNQCGLSCIPEGTYHCRPRYSRKYKHHCILEGVQGRTFILVHRGNFAGDRTKGYKTHTRGCILLGARFGILSGQECILSSYKTYAAFLKYLSGQEFMLTITSEQASNSRRELLSQEFRALKS